LRLEFFYDNVDACFKYMKDKKLCVEIKPMELDVILARYFKGKGVILISATPFGEHRRVEYRIPHRSVVYYCPIAKLTREAIDRNPVNLDKAIEFIKETFIEYKKCGLTKKAVIHCGNLGYASYAASKLSDFSVDLHVRGEQRQIVNQFRRDDADFLCIVAAEYGIDFYEPEIALQFILKVPYATRDERIKALEKEPGYDTWYERDALIRLIQACGRIARGDKFSATFILDSKFFSLHSKYPDLSLDWFKERLVYASSL